jgi:hypothetical protein
MVVVAVIPRVFSKCACVLWQKFSVLPMSPFTETVLTGASCKTPMPSQSGVHVPFESGHQGRVRLHPVRGHPWFIQGGICLYEYVRAHASVPSLHLPRNDACHPRWKPIQGPSAKGGVTILGQFAIHDHVLHGKTHNFHDAVQIVPLERGRGRGGREGGRERR